MIVIKGLGGGLLVTRGYGGLTSARIGLFMDPSYPFQFETAFQTKVVEFETGSEWRGGARSFPKRRITTTYNTLTQVEMEELYGFFVSKKGAREAFSFFDPVPGNHKGEYVGRGDGSSVLFELPVRGSGSLVVYVNGVQVGVTLLEGAGTDGVDKIQFSSAPANGSVIAADFEGKLRLTVRLESDKIPRELFYYLMYNIGVSFVEARAA